MPHQQVVLKSGSLRWPGPVFYPRPILEGHNQCLVVVVERFARTLFLEAASGICPPVYEQRLLSVGALIGTTRPAADDIAEAFIRRS